jgi:hypothetical protein
MAFVIPRHRKAQPVLLTWCSCCMLTLSSNRLFVTLCPATLEANSTVTFGKYLRRWRATNVPSTTNTTSRLTIPSGPCPLGAPMCCPAWSCNSVILLRGISLRVLMLPANCALLSVVLSLLGSPALSTPPSVACSSALRHGLASRAFCPSVCANPLRPLSLDVRSLNTPQRPSRLNSVSARGWP